MPKVILHRPQIRAPIGEVIAAGVPEHVGPDPAAHVVVSTVGIAAHSQLLHNTHADLVQILLVFTIRRR